MCFYVQSKSKFIYFLCLHVISTPRHPMRSCCQTVTLTMLSSASLKLNLIHSVHFSICERHGVLKPCQSSALRVLTLLVFPGQYAVPRLPPDCSVSLVCRYSPGLKVPQLLSVTVSYRLSQSTADFWQG